jgi:hypothetical protein
VRLSSEQPKSNAAEQKATNRANGAAHRHDIESPSFRHPPRRGVTAACRFWKRLTALAPLGHYGRMWRVAFTIVHAARMNTRAYHSVRAD